MPYTQERMRLQIARELWKAGCVTIRTRPSFRWASGLLSPIYNDNRLLLGRPESRERVVRALLATIRERRLSYDRIAGVATAGIPWATLLAERLGKPLLYVRPAPKGHGRRQRLEGVVAGGDRIILIEDLVSTGGSSLTAVAALRRAGARVSDLLAVFAYLPAELAPRLRRHRLELHPLSEAEALLAAGRELKKLDRQKEATARRFLSRLATHLAQ